ncbi:MAG: hypothetical protein K8R46_07800 [Pirellulales bacterium]|nr:hypothetical protein [Pirellulales bacterium]
MSKIKNKALEFLKQKSYTVQELCDLLGTDDDLKITSIITELQIERKIRLLEYMPICREDGGAIILGKYKAV